MYNRTLLVVGIVLVLIGLVGAILAGVWMVFSRSTGPTPLPRMIPRGPRRSIPGTPGPPGSRVLPGVAVSSAGERLVGGA